MVNSPVYPPFFPFVETMGEVVEAPLGRLGRLDLDVLAEAFTRATAGGRSAAYLLCSPQNPTGVVHTAEELAGVAALAAEHRVRVVVDEIHAPLVLDGATFTPYLSVPGTEDAMCLHSASKGWNLCGLKAAVLVAGEDAADDLARIPEIVGHGPSHLGALSHAAAYAEGGEWLDALRAGLVENRGLLGDLLAEHLPGATWQPPEATFLSWIDCRDVALGIEEAPAQRGLVTLNAGPSAAFLERSRVALSSGPAFGTGGEHHVRLNYATSPGSSPWRWSGWGRRCRPPRPESEQGARAPCARAPARASRPRESRE